MLSLVEENYLKAIYHLSQGGEQVVSTNAIAEVMQTKPASVSDMIQKLDRKQVISYTKYQGVTITAAGRQKALRVIRKHRLWEVFLVEHLNFNWDQVHEVAEQLEHIKSPLLIERLDQFLGYPQVDPHGDPIPDADGVIRAQPQVELGTLAIGADGVIKAVRDSSASFLQHMDKIGAYLGAHIHVVDKEEFDGSLRVTIDSGSTTFVSREVASNILVAQKA